MDRLTRSEPDVPADQDMLGGREILAVAAHPASSGARWRISSATAASILACTSPALAWACGLYATLTGAPGLSELLISAR